MEFTSWLTTWLARHPLKTPSEIDPTRYTTEVIARVKALAPTPTSRPVSPLQLVWGWLRLALVVATAASIAVVIGTTRSSRERLAHRVTRDAQLLAELDEPPPELLNGQETAELAQDLEAEDHQLLLAESAPNQDQQWLEQTLQLLDQLDENVPGVDSDEPLGNDDEEWLKELDTLDEGPSSTSS